MVALRADAGDLTADRRMGDNGLAGSRNPDERLAGPDHASASGEIQLHVACHPETRALIPEARDEAVMPLEGYHVYGGEGPILHLAHANGFPPGTYGPLAATLTDRFRVVARPLRPLWPESRPESAPDWRILARDLAAALDAAGLHGIAAAGHSIGGVLTLWAAIWRPDLFRAVILIDPVLLAPRRLRILRLVQALKLGDRQPLVQRALRRRSAWPGRQACFDDYRQKPFFARWSDAALWAYVEAGTRPAADGGVELVYPREWEAHIFATTPVDVWPDLSRLKAPTLVVRGELSVVFDATCQRLLARRVPNARLATVRGAGHLVPMERPTETGAAIRTFLEGLDRPGDWE